MFALPQDNLLLSLRGAKEMRLCPSGDNRARWESVDTAYRAGLVARAEQAMQTEIPLLTFSGYEAFCREGKPEYRQAAALRREMLKALALGVCAQGTNRYAGKMADLIYLIGEECAWGYQEAVYPEGDPKALDRSDCETGALLVTASKLCAFALDPLSPRIARFARNAADYRLIRPMAEGDALVCGMNDAAPALEALLVCALSSQRDERMRWMCLRRLCRMTEALIQRVEAGETEGLEAALEASDAVLNILALLKNATGGEVDKRRDPVVTALADWFVQSHVAGAWFVNPGGELPRPDLAPEALFRLGADAGDRRLTGLAAALRKNERRIPLRERTPSLYSQVTAAFYQNDFLRETARVSSAQDARIPGSRLMAARMDGFYAALAGGRGPHAGELILFYEGQPIILGPCGGDARLHSVPLVTGAVQDAQMSGARDAEEAGGESYRMLSMNIAPAYPQRARLLNWQRTLLFVPSEGGVRMMDVFDFDEGGGYAVFRFLTPRMPALSEGWAKIGPVVMTWEGDLEARVEPIAVSSPQARLDYGERAYLVELATTRAPRGSYSFVFRPAG